LIGTIDRPGWPRWYQFGVYGMMDVVVGMRELRGLIDMSLQCGYIVGGVSGSSGTTGGCGEWITLAYASILLCGIIQIEVFI